MPASLAPNRLTALRADLRRTGAVVIDLTESNPTRAGLSYPEDLLTPLADPRGLHYRPEPFGLLEARCAVVGDFARRGQHVAADHVALTASTSEAYGVLFKLLCDPGDEVLVPTPSYPLFEHLTALDGVRSIPYPLEFHGSWTLDLGALDALATDRTRAVLIVSPNNPTGHFMARAEMRALADWCRSRDLPIILDEVFADYELVDGTRARAGALTAMPEVLGFTLGGLSKSIGLPQLKLAWIAVTGPEREVDAAAARLEVICDAYLSVSTPVQAAAAALLDRGRTVREQIQGRIRTNHRRLATLLSETPSCQLLEVEAGWSAVLRVPSFMAEEDLVLSLLAEDHVLVHPGYFFDFPTESYVIASLLPPPATFDEGVTRLLRRFAQPA